MGEDRILENKYVNISSIERDLVLSTLKLGQIAGTAPIVSEYELKLAQFFGVKYAIAVSSGTAALHAILLAAKIGPGDEVILPPTAPVMCALPIIAVGARPVFADVLPISFGLDTGSVARMMTGKTRAIVTVPMWGYPANSEDLHALAANRGVLFIEDVSHCHGAIEDNQLMGTYGDVSFFSTQERKLISTGEGGFILSRDAQLAERLREVRDFGKTQSEIPSIAESKGKYGYGFGLNFRIPALSAALGIAQLGRLREKIDQRTKNAHWIIAKLQSKGLPLTEWPIEKNGIPNYYSMIIKCSDERYDMRRVGRGLAKHGVISDTFRFGGTMLYELPEFSESRRDDCVNALNTFSSIATLPTHEGMTASDLEHVVMSVEIAMESGVNNDVD